MSDKAVHLFRGPPGVRSWSKYQATVEGWTLCGINRRVGRRAPYKPSIVLKTVPWVLPVCTCDAHRTGELRLAVRATYRR
jgi:hypothetical protein